MRLNNMKIFALALSILTSLFAGTVLAERTTTYFHSDGLGSIVAASDENGDLLWRKQYQPFGAQIAGSDTSEDTSFTGKQFDKDTGLTYFGARYYDPMIGRFTSTDPVGPLASESNPFFFNRYAYANNNPYRYVDPDGRTPIIPAIIFTVGLIAESGDANAPSKEGQKAPKPEPDPTVLVPGGKQAKSAMGVKNVLKNNGKKQGGKDATKSGAGRLANKVQGLPASQRPNTVAVIKHKNGAITVGRNQGGVQNSTVQNAINNSPKNCFGGQCAETNAMARALNKGRSLDGASISVSNVRGAGSTSGVHGTAKAPCSTCASVINKLIKK